MVHDYFGNDTTWIGKLQVTTDRDIASYGGHIRQYLEMLRGLEGQNMPFSQLKSQYLDNIEYPHLSRSQRRDWVIGIRPLVDPRRLVFSAVVREFINARIPAGACVNHEDNHEVARLPLDELVLGSE